MAELVWIGHFLACSGNWLTPTAVQSEQLNIQLLAIDGLAE